MERGNPPVCFQRNPKHSNKVKNLVSLEEILNLGDISAVLNKH